LPDWCHSCHTPLFQRGTKRGEPFRLRDNPHFSPRKLTIAYPFAGEARRDGVEGQVESNERYYRRRAVEERMAAQRAVTETAREWHSKLAHDFAERAGARTVAICGAAAING
jgi:hypothetical protein